MKRELLKELIKITKEQKEQLEIEDVDGYIESLNRRQEILEKLQVLYKETPSLKEQDDHDLIDELIKLDNENRIEFQRQFEETTKKLKEIRSMRKSEIKYSTPYSIATEEGVFFDKRNGKR